MRYQTGPTNLKSLPCGAGVIGRAPAPAISYRNHHSGHHARAVCTVLVFIVIALVFGAVALTVVSAGPRHAMRRRTRPTSALRGLEDARMQFDGATTSSNPVHHLRSGDRLPFPWAVAFRDIGVTGFVA